MKAVKIAILTGLLALGIATQAAAAPFEITFDLGGGVTGSGQIDVQQDVNGNSFAASGYLDVFGGTPAGNWTLYSAGGNAIYPGYLTSPASAYWYNNAYYPTGVNPQYPSINMPLDNYGLLFTLGNGDELNLWGNADGTFTLHGSIGGFQNYSIGLYTSGGPGVPTISFSAIPEPATLALTAIAGLCFAARRFAARRIASS